MNLHYLSMSLDLVVSKISQNKKRKIVQYASFYHLLSTSSIMTNFKCGKDLFTMFKVKHIPKKHWSDFTRWGIVESMNELFKSI